MALPGLSGIAHWAPDHAGHLAGRAVLGESEGDLIRAGHAPGQGAQVTVARRRFPGRRGAARSFRPSHTLESRLAHEPPWGSRGSGRCRAAAEAPCRAPGRFAPAKGNSRPRRRRITHVTCR